MWSVSQALATLTLIAFAVVALYVIVGAWRRIASPQSAVGIPILGNVWAQSRDSALGLAWVVALVATLGSLYLSEIAQFPPCTLCWLQRIAMYPLVVMLGIAALREDNAIRWYALPLAAIGAALAFYHTLLQRFPGLQGATSCSMDAPCNVMWVREFGFVSIPVMALGAFLLIAALVLVDRSAAASDAAAERRSRRRG